MAFVLSFPLHPMSRLSPTVLLDKYLSFIFFAFFPHHNDYVERNAVVFS